MATVQPPAQAAPLASVAAPLYPAPITQRLKGQRYDPDLLPMFLSQQGEVHEGLELPEVLQGTYTVEQVGTFMAPSHYRRDLEIVHRAYVVTRPDGLKVPAYSLNGDSYVVCQHHGWRAGR